MKIFTSYFGNLNNIPKNIIQISIAGKSPDYYNGFEYKKLAPKYSFFKEYKDGLITSIEYVEKYYEQVLNKLNRHKVVNDFMSIGKSNDVVLLCYEKPTEFCHRQIVVDWLKDSYNIVGEYNEF